MKKIVLKLELYDDKAKQKALKTVSTLPGIDSMAMDMKEMKLTVMGTVDPVSIVSKLRKNWPTTALISVGPAKEPEKKEPKKEEAAAAGSEKKEEGKKEEEKKAGGGEGEKKEEKKEEGKKEGEGGGDEKKAGGEEAKKVVVPAPAPAAPVVPVMPYMDPRMYHYHDMVKAYRANYNPPMQTHYYVQSVEENPNAMCTIC